MTPPVLTLVILGALVLACASPDQRTWIERELDEQLAVEEYNRLVAPEDRIRCRWLVKTGSLIKKKVCMTVAQLEAERGRTEKFLDDQQTASARAGQPYPSGGPRPAAGGRAGR